MLGDRWMYSLLPFVIGILAVCLLSFIKPSINLANGSKSYRFGSGEFFDPIADIYDTTNRLMVSNYRFC